MDAELGVEERAKLVKLELADGIRKSGWSETASRNHKWDARYGRLAVKAVVDGI